MNSAVLSIGKVTDVGKLRSRNEDSMGVRRSETDEGVSLFVVADGMGGHSAGNVASQMAVEHVLEAFFRTHEADLTERLRHSVEEANRKIYEKAQSKSELFRMGTTVVSTAVLDSIAYVANVGDSRAYLVRGDEIRQVTRDHSWVALQVEMGELTPEEALTSQNRSVLLRCLGEKPDVLVDIFRVRLRPGDVLVLCSDGLHGQVTPAEIREFVQSRPPQQACDDLMALANDRGGPDNITVQAIRIDSCTEPGEAESALPVVTFVEPPEKEHASPARSGDAEATAGGAPSATGAPVAEAPLPPPLPPLPEPIDPTPPLPWGPLVVAFLLGMLCTFVAMRASWINPNVGPYVPPAASPSAEGSGAPDLVIPGGTQPSGAPSRGVASPSPARSSSSADGSRVVAYVPPPPPRTLVATPVSLYAVGEERIYRCDLAKKGRSPEQVLEEVRLPPGKGILAAAADLEAVYLARGEGIHRLVGPNTTEAARTVPTGGDVVVMVAGAQNEGVYWADGKGVIHRWLARSPQGEKIAETGAKVVGLAVSPQGEVYWASKGSGIQRGSSGQVDVKAKVEGLDSDAGHLYWCEAGCGEQGGRVFRCSYEGRQREVLQSSEGSMAFAVNEDSVFWMVSEKGRYVIKAAPTQGSFRSAGG